MTKITIRYFREKPGKAGPRYFWQPSAELRRAGWRQRRLVDATGPNAGQPIAELHAALAACERLNAEVDRWRAGLVETATPAAPATTPGGARTFAALVEAYRAAPRYAKLAPKTRRDYDWCLGQLVAWAGDVAAAAIDRPMVLEFYETVQPVAPAKANALVRVLRIVMKYGWDKGWIASNPAAQPGLIATAPRLRIWTEAELLAVCDAADESGQPSITDAVWLARYTGQRQGDLLRITRLQCTGGRVRLTQAKRGAAIDVPFVPRLAARVEAAVVRAGRLAPASPYLLICEATKRPWKADHFRHAFAAVRAAAAKDCPSVATAWFMDLRDTAVTALAEAGCTVPEIAAITGHSEGSATGVLRHYLALNSSMAESAIAKLVAHEEAQAAARAAKAEEG